jgi:hypothetical protein
VVAGSTLVAAAVFQSLHRRVQATVDRRFNRSRVDAERALEAFGVGLREEVDLDAVSGRTVATVERVIEPSVVALWLGPGTGAS